MVNYAIYCLGALVNVLLTEIATFSDSTCTLGRPKQGKCLYYDAW